MDAKTALIVDDSKMSRMMITRIIKEHFPDWQIIEAGNAEEALAAVENKSVDIMTLDFNMPGMDGLELGSKLREQFPDAKISLITANIQSAIKERAKAAAIQFVPKPITEDRVLGYLRAAAL